MLTWLWFTFLGISRLVIVGFEKFKNTDTEWSKLYTLIRVACRYLRASAAKGLNMWFSFTLFLFRTGFMVGLGIGLGFVVLAVIVMFCIAGCFIAKTCRDVRIYQLFSWAEFFSTKVESKIKEKASLQFCCRSLVVELHCWIPNN